jgi:amino acid adenylation domain-containing protein
MTESPPARRPWGSTGAPTLAQRAPAARGRDEATIHELFEDQVVRDPAATAVIYDGEALSYGELNARANQVAHHLRRLGVGPESLVALFLDRSFDLIVGLLGVLKAGAAYVPIDTDYPHDRVAFMLADCGARAVLGHERLLDRLPATAADVICLDRDAPVIRAQPVENPMPTASALNLAYVIYTSGSTGVPKGVAVPHGGVCAFARGEQELFRIRPDDRVLQFFALGFDASVEELTLSLLNGAALYIPSERRRRWRLAQVLEESAVTVASLPPSALAALPALDLPCLRLLLVGGEACPPGVARTWSAGRSFYNTYGPTEATVVATCYGVDGVPDDSVRVPIGDPLTGTEVYLLDPDLNVVSEGPGEIYIGGAGVTRGYLGRPDLTAERFLPDPFAPAAGARMYRSGDLAHRNGDGQLEFLGRVDEQVKVNGFRIEPAEVEAALVDHPGVREAVVLAVEDEGGATRLTAFVVRHGAASAPAPVDLRQHLLRRLPEFLVPQDYVLLDELPLTPNDKVDRRRLAATTGRGGAAGVEASVSESVRGDVVYGVVVNGEGHHSIWPVDRAIPRGWTADGTVGLLEACLSHIAARWTDMRPASVRDAGRD